MKQVNTMNIKSMAYTNGADWLTVSGLARLHAASVLGGKSTSDVAKAIVRTYGRSEAREMLTHLVKETEASPSNHDVAVRLLRMV
jgi:3-keto-L-gulonate-6-phosphate decarboxylase